MKLDLETNEISEVRSMVRGRYNHASTIVGNKLIVVGDDRDYPIELLDLEEEALGWQPIIAPLIGERFNPLVVTIG